jgi:hypothetical protein
MVISFGGGGVLTGISSTVAAAVSVPFSSTVMLALCRASPMNSSLFPVMPLKSATLGSKREPRSHLSSTNCSSTSSPVRVVALTVACPDLAPAGTRSLVSKVRSRSASTVASFQTLPF